MAITEWQLLIDLSKLTSKDYNWVFLNSKKTVRDWPRRWQRDLSWFTLSWSTISKSTNSISKQNQKIGFANLPIVLSLEYILLYGIEDNVRFHYCEDEVSLLRHSFLDLSRYCNPLSIMLVNEKENTFIKYNFRRSTLQNSY